MRDILLTIQYISIISLFLESWIIIKRWKNRLHSYLLFSCIVTLVNNIGYLFELKSFTLDSYINALQMSYFGRVWIVLAMFLFTTELIKFRVPEMIKRFLVLIYFGIYIVVFTLRNHKLYYYNTSFSMGKLFPMFSHQNGIVHHIYLAMNLMLILNGMTLLFIAYRKEKGIMAKKRYHIVFTAFSIETLFYLWHMSGINDFLKVYDVTMIGNAIGTFLMLFAIHRYNLLGTGELAREFMIDRLAEGIIAVDPEGSIQYYNEHAVEIFPMISISGDAVIENIKTAIESGENILVKDRIYSPEERDLAQGDDDYGKLYALVDETDHIRYMDELRKQKELADSASVAKSRFLANMSHEIRTPINAVLGMDEMILRETKEKTTRSYATDIMAAGKTLLSLIGDILDFSKVEEGKMEIIPVQYELSSVINDLYNMIRDRAAKKGLTFNVEVSEHIPRVLFGDEIRIRQCALNLLTNAVKYTEKGSVTMTFSSRKKDDSHIMLGFSVADTGIGMKKEDIDALFSPYIRIEEKRNRAIEGTGLGMSITRQLLDLMGSELIVESEYGKGSVLSFELEQEIISTEEIGNFSERFNEIRGEDFSYHELFHAPDARILVVDDTEMNITVMQNLLKKTMMRIDTALSGEDALTLAAVNEYDIIFIDHMMPGMDGLETLERLRADGKNHDTPAVALTANAVSGARQKYLAAGFTDYISKPIDGTKLEKLIRLLLPDEKIKITDTSDESVNDVSSFEKSKILVVDDDEAVCALVRSVMEPVYEVQECLLGKEAVRAAKRFAPDLIMLDVHLPDENGFAVMQALKEDVMTDSIPVLLLTGDNDSVTEENGFRSGAADYIRKPFVPDVLRQRTKRIIDLFRYQQSIEKEVERQASRSRRLSREMMMTLSKTVDTKDHYTDGHSRRVAAISAEIGRRLGKNAEEQVELYETGLLHDIGKIGVHEDIIQKNSRLTDNEFAEIKEHTVKGYEILKEIVDMPRLCEGARWHHERFDGSGYPDGLAGNEIPETARIVCVADCYDAMTSTRTYSVPRKQEDVRAEIERCSGTMFDPEVAKVLIAMIDEDKDYNMNERAFGQDIWKEYDRLWGNISVSGLPAEGAQGSELPGELRKIEGLNIEVGLKNCGSNEGFMSVLSVFHTTAPAKANEIETLFNEKAIDDYTIKVHALKSSARIIGAAELSALAEQLEDAGKTGNTELIEKETGRLLKMYRALDGSLKCLDDKGKTLEPISLAALKEAYQTICEIAQSMDYGLMDDILKNLKDHALTAAAAANVDTMENMLSQLDWDGIADVAKKAMEELR